jgi:hypothetical protein
VIHAEPDFALVENLSGEHGCFGKKGNPTFS